MELAETLKRHVDSQLICELKVIIGMYLTVTIQQTFAEFSTKMFKMYDKMLLTGSFVFKANKYMGLFASLQQYRYRRSVMLNSILARSNTQFENWEQYFTIKMSLITSCYFNNTYCVYHITCILVWSQYYFMTVILIPSGLSLCSGGT